MQGHVRRRGKKWAIVVELDRDPATGKRRQKWVSGFATESAAEKALRARLTAIDKGEDPFPADEALTVEQWVATWLEYLRTNSEIRPRTIESYDQLTRDHVVPKIGCLVVRKVRPQDVQGVLDAMTAAGKSPRTVEHCRAAMSGAFQHAFRMSIVSSNVVRATRAPRKREPQLRTPTAAELSRIIDKARGTQWEVAILLAATTGARRSEVLGLRWGNVDLEAGRARIVESVQRIDGKLVWTPPKSARSTRTVLLTGQVVTRLRAYRAEQAQRLLALGVRVDDSTPLCDDGKGQPMDPDGFTHATHDIAEAAGVPGVRLHDLRHGVCTMLAEQGVAPELISQLAGHATVGFTLTRYTHPSADRLAEVGDALDRAFGS